MTPTPLRDRIALIRAAAAERQERPEARIRRELDRERLAQARAELDALRA